MRHELKLRGIKILHTLVWAALVGAIFTAPVFAFHGRLVVAWGLIGLVTMEVIVLLANDNRCPLTDVAGRYTEDRRDNFDIYLPLWLARHNKTVFGVIHVAGVLYVIWVSLEAWG